MSLKTRELKVSYSNIEDAIASFLISMSAINDNEEIVDIKIPNLKTDKDGLVKLTVATMKAN